MSAAEPACCWSRLGAIAGEPRLEFSELALSGGGRENYEQVLRIPAPFRRSQVFTPRYRGFRPMITQLTLENWKSYDRAILQIDPLTVLIGTNASGKSN